MLSAKTRLRIGGVLLIAICFVLLSPVHAAGDPKATKYGLEDVFSGNSDENLNSLRITTGDPNRPVLPTLIGNIISTGLSFIAIVFFVLILYGGVLWMIARGNEDQTRKALKIIEAAIIGIIIVLGSYALTRYVMSSTQADTPVNPQGLNSPSDRPASNSVGSTPTCPRDVPTSLYATRDLFSCLGKQVGDVCNKRESTFSNTIRGLCGTFNDGGQDYCECQPDPSINTRCVERPCARAYTLEECETAFDCEIDRSPGSAPRCIVRGDFPCNTFTSSQCGQGDSQHCERR